MGKYLSVTEYAQLTGKDPGNIRRMLIERRLDGRKIGNQWVISEDAEYPRDKRETTGRYRNWRKRTELCKNKKLMSTIRTMVKDLQKIYGVILSEVILYGSYARGTQTEESDVDIAVILKEKPSKEVSDAMIECVASYELASGKVLSVIDINSEMYCRWEKTLPFYMSIRKEGIVLWKEAA